jgi:hypothetical protein
MEGVLLALRKKALVEEYFGDATWTPKWPIVYNCI